MGFSFEAWKLVLSIEYVSVLMVLVYVNLIGEVGSRARDRNDGSL